MAVVTPVLAIEERVSSIRCHGIGIPSSGRREMVGQTVAGVTEDKICVAVGKDVGKSKSTLIWALQNSGGKGICIIHVHQPAQMIPVMKPKGIARIRSTFRPLLAQFLDLHLHILSKNILHFYVLQVGAKFPVSALKEQEVRIYRDTERRKMLKTLDEYLLICRNVGVRAEKLYTEMDSVEKGIVELISQHGIQKLVMGAAGDRQYWRRMMDLKSRKAIFVRKEAPASCHIWFTCKGCLIYTREEKMDETHRAVALSSLPAISNTGTPEDSRSNFEKPYTSSHERISYPFQGYDFKPWLRYSSRRSISDTESMSTPRSWMEGEGSSSECDRFSRTPSQASGLSLHSSIRISDIASFIPLETTRETEAALALGGQTVPQDEIYSPSPPSVLDRSIDDVIFNRLQHATEEVQNSKREAYEEAFRRQRAEKDAFVAMRRVKASETLYTEELKRREQVELSLAKEKEELEKMKSQQNVVREELQIALDQKSFLENQIAETDELVKELEQKIITAVDLLQSYKKERDELQMERDRALREAEELRKNQSEASGQQSAQLFTIFSFSEIEEATNSFDPTLKIGEGGYGNIYKGILRHTQVAVKLLHSTSSQGPAEFQQEVDVLCKMRHPNLITLIGACPEAWTLIYEYLSNGSLEDRLGCKDNSPPLSWQTRVRIATELCAALIFLHTNKPHSIVHGDLKPANILLDANYVSKLSDFGICRLVSENGCESNTATMFCKTDPKGTFAYMDPEFLSCGELTPKSDVYSFGIILLRLLTGRAALGIAKEVKYALDTGGLKNLLDPLAGDWPFVQAEQLARLALRCCEVTRKDRPDLATEVWRMLEPMKASCGGSTSFRLGSRQHHSQPPPYFICPIFQEVMQDPHVAADGFTYEGEAIRAWLESGHDTSPMTNLELPHTSLVPNHALRSAIQEWLQQH